MDREQPGINGGLSKKSRFEGGHLSGNESFFWLTSLLMRG